MEIVPSDIEVDIVIKDGDGQAWYEDGKIVINVNLWLTDNIDKIIEDINKCFIHEYIEHVLGLGHENAVIAEKIVTT